MRRPFSLHDPVTLRRLCQARDHLADRHGEPVPLAAAARAAHLSPFHFHRLFSRAFGESPHRFLTRRRMELAKRLLATDHLSVTEVCFEVGYSSLGSFSAKFRSQVGSAPSEFRREVRRIFGYEAPWRILYIPGCILLRLAGPRQEPQDPRSVAPGAPLS